MISDRTGVFVYVEDSDFLIIGENYKHHLDLLKDNTELLVTGDNGEVLKSRFEHYAFGHISDNTAYIDSEVSYDCDLKKAQKKVLNLQKFKDVIII